MSHSQAFLPRNKMQCAEKNEVFDGKVVLEVRAACLSEGERRREERERSSLGSFAARW
jgi:hypothetical protein